MHGGPDDRRGIRVRAGLRAPDDLIGAAVFLSSAAADFVNGHILYVDGGLLACLGDPDALPVP